MEVTQNDYLMHYGRRGMKWYQHIFTDSDGNSRLGSRRSRSDGDGETGGVKRRGRSLKKNQGSSYKKASEMSDAELNNAINRFRLEETYNSYISKMTPQKSNKAKNFVSDVLEKSGKNIATQATTYAMGAAVNKFAKQLGIEGDIVNPKKGQKDK